MNNDELEVPMISPILAAQAGVIPLKPKPEKAARFAVGSPNGLTSNSWRIWASKHGDVYIACRDNFKEAKVSLHASGRWRMGFTTEAISKNSHLLPSDQNRAWEVWDQPPISLPNTVIAFQLVFPTSELAVRPEQRIPKEWKDVIFIEAAPPGKLTILTLFVTVGDMVLTHECEPSFCLASLDIGGGRYAQLIAHGDPENDLPQLLEQSVAEAQKQAKISGITIPDGAYGYFFGKRENGSRFLFGACIN
ncbi:hypothetical protein [Phormidesmis priestleyi]|uniref:hypothetical protein n=1 Tax=Phormidesmis priestleyi TaxID=268141 RepID=UPI000839E00E|nr:hypothetical protein [Phormidesmis priestleyi]